MSYFTQMAGWRITNFASAAVESLFGDCVHSRIARREKENHRQRLGRYDAGWVWVLVPACVLYAFVLIASGVPQNCGL